jgi:hypothetical protein
MVACDYLHSERRYDERITQVVERAGRGAFTFFEAKMHHGYKLSRLNIEQHHIPALRTERSTGPREHQGARRLKISCGR